MSSGHFWLGSGFSLGAAPVPKVEFLGSCPFLLTRSLCSILSVYLHEQLQNVHAATRTDKTHSLPKMTYTKLQRIWNQRFTVHRRICAPQDTTTRSKQRSWPAIYLNKSHYLRLHFLPAGLCQCNSYPGGQKAIIVACKAAILSFTPFSSPHIFIPLKAQCPQVFLTVCLDKGQNTDYCYCSVFQ